MPTQVGSDSTKPRSKRRRCKCCKCSAVLNLPKDPTVKKCVALSLALVSPFLSRSLSHLTLSLSLSTPQVPVQPVRSAAAGLGTADSAKAPGAGLHGRRKEAAPPQAALRQ